MLVSGELEHLAADPGIAGAEQPDVGDALGQHEQPVQAHAEGKPALPVARRRPARRDGRGRLPKPPPSGPWYTSTWRPCHRVRVVRGSGVGQARGERTEQDRDHLVQVGAAHRPAGDPPQVELVWSSGVLPVDGVAAVHDPRAGQQHIVARPAGEPAQRRRDHRAGMAAEHVPGVHVPGVAGITGDRISHVPEPVVVVGDRHDPGTATSEPHSSTRDILLHGPAE